MFVRLFDLVVGLRLWHPFADVVVQRSVVDRSVRCRFQVDLEWGQRMEDVVCACIRLGQTKSAIQSGRMSTSRLKSKRKSMGDPQLQGLGSLSLRVCNLDSL